MGSPGAGAATTGASSLVGQKHNRATNTNMSVHHLCGKEVPLKAHKDNVPKESRKSCTGALWLLLLSADQSLARTARKRAQ
jgi:hypothetical protein